MAKGNRGGKRAGSSGLTLTQQQNDKINSLKKNILKIKNAIPQSLTFSQGDNGKINYSYQTQQLVVQSHAGKMVDPMKDKMYDRTYTNTGYINLDGSLVRNAPTHQDVYLGTRKQLLNKAVN